MEQTTIRDLNHKPHRFPASLSGLCIIQGAYHLNAEMARYDEIMEKWKALGGSTQNLRRQELQRHQKELEELVKEQDSGEHSEDSWGHTRDMDAQADFYREDLYFYAACAFAGGLPYEMEGFETGQPEKFREFWSEWLLEALKR